MVQRSSKPAEAGQSQSAPEYPPGAHCTGGPESHEDAPRFISFPFEYDTTFGPRNAIGVNLRPLVRKSSPSSGFPYRAISVTYRL